MLLIFGGLGLLFVPIIVATVLFGEGPAAGTAMIILWIGGVAGAFYLNRASMPGAAARAKEWEARKAEWQLAYYCERDDLVFLPNTTQSWTSAQFYDHLRRPY